MAKQLIGSLAGDFEPDKYHDSYREDVLALIERKAAGKEIAVQPEAEEEQTPAPDLMSALKASLEAVRAHGDSGSDAAKPRKATKKAPAKKAAAKASAAKASAKKAPAKKAAAKKAPAKRAAAKR